MPDRITLTYIVAAVLFVAAFVGAWREAGLSDALDIEETKLPRSFGRNQKRAALLRVGVLPERWKVEKRCERS